MIRINLLAEKKAKKGKRAAAAAALPSFPSEGPNPLLIGGICILVALGILGFQYNGLQKEAQKIAAETTTAKRESTRLAGVKRQYDQRRLEAEQYERQVKVIDDLRSNQVGPVSLLTKLSETVNQTDAVWLNNMAQNGDSISLDGVALSTHAIADLITNLNRSGYFSGVELKDATQDAASGKLQSFNFSITCSKQAQPQPQTQTPQQQQQPKKS